MATSVFTHLLPSTTEQYVSEIARTVRRDGRFLSTWFLLDDVTDASIAAGTATMQFAHDLSIMRKEALFLRKKKSLTGGRTSKTRSPAQV